jgi:hypothetical protein
MPYYPAGGKTYTLGASISSTATSITLSSFTLPVSGTLVTMAVLNTDIAYGTLDPKTSSSEFISFTGITQNANGTATLTGVTRGLNKVHPFTTNTAYRLPHSGQSVFILSDAPQVFNEYAVLRNANVFSGIQEFTLLPTSSGGNATTGDQLVTYAQALSMATGTTAINRVVVAGNGGENIAAGQLVYLLVTDGEWYLCDADTAATVDNIILGIAQGAGSNGTPITSGVLLFGLDSNQTGLTNNTAYFAGNTAGAISATVGTVEVSVGISRSTTSLLFYPRYNQQLTEDQQDALVGTSGTPSNTNRFVTNADTTGTGSVIRQTALDSAVAGKFDGTRLTRLASYTTANNTTENTVFTTTITGGLLSTNGMIRASMPVYFNTTATAVTWTIRLKYGGSTINTLTLSTPAGGSFNLLWVGEIRAIIMNNGATNSQNVSLLAIGGANGPSSTNFHLGPATNSATDATSAIDTTTSQTLAVTIQANVTPNSSVGVFNQTIVETIRNS